MRLTRTTIRAMTGAVAGLLLAASAAQAEGLVTTRSANTFETTHTSLVAGIAARGFTVIADVDHARAAGTVGATLRPTRVVIFGNPRGGTPLMACQQSMGIDLPLKALITEAADGAVSVTYNEPSWMATRHKLADCGKPVIEAMTGALKGLVADAVKQ